MQTFIDVIDLWPTATVFAAEIGEKPATVRQWRSRDRIPPEKWQTILSAARERGFNLDADQLVSISGAAPLSDISTTRAGS